MKIYIADDKRLIVEPSWFDRFDHKGEIYVNEPKAKIQLKAKVAEEIEQDIRKTMAEVIARFQTLFEQLPLDEIFDEKRKQIRESYDTEQAIADVIERWQK
ncbi:TPA: hypothetical protein ACGPBJ_001246 [Streptococcus suis]|nr:hypothetical protein [Streptococcus suis]